ncbi:MAG: NADP-specific glutamate dehydrogenase [Sedimentisphaerales bacterium]|nr:NADP-specific glutamate dehydrogenase [Planctomycetota bacterium]MDY0355498.1 NADP-specific glutamate dehydrogenase [Sedimentisphaerales bacterium]NLT77868.1 NADP-specific glutamate dehydrogenase [Planctomycetota bacterium]
MTVLQSVAGKPGTQAAVETFMEGVVAQSLGEVEFHQAVREVAESVMPVVQANPAYREARVLERLAVPDMVIMFRVVWADDNGQVHVNRGYRVRMSNLVGPYKGGLRFHPSVNLGVLKFLAFEQIFKNSLTTLLLGGAKGGSDFDPKGRSDGEIMRFCQAFMTALFRYIGPDIDVPAGDIGVGGREIGYLFGQYRKLTGCFHGSLTGKSLNWGGSNLRPEATGYGAVYFAEEMLATRKEGIAGKTATVSGSGNVAQYTVEKLNALGAKALTLSDSNGTIVDPDGIDDEKLAWVMDLKNVRRGRIQEYVEKFRKAEYLPGKRPWSVPCDLAFPSATQNEVDEDDARQLVANGCVCVSEGANMPSTPRAVDVFQEAGILYGPGKAANAGGVAVSGLEMNQNAGCMKRSREAVDEQLRGIMCSIHENCVKYGTNPNGVVDYVRGANTAAFVKIADAMLQQGYV